MYSKREQLIQDGFCVFENVLTPEMVKRTNAVSNRLLDAQDAEYFEAQKSTGSLISIYNDDFFAELVTWPKALNVLREMGFDGPTFSSGFVISKPPHSPPLFWHQDWWGWNDPISYEPLPQQVFLMYYLVDTSRENGCLRLIEGSPLKTTSPARHNARSTYRRSAARIRSRPSGLSVVSRRARCSRARWRSGHRRFAVIAQRTRQQNRSSADSHHTLVSPDIQRTTRRHARPSRRTGTRYQSTGLKKPPEKSRP